MSEHHANPMAQNPPPADFIVSPVVQGGPPPPIFLRPMWDPAAGAYRIQACLMVADARAVRFGNADGGIVFAAVPFDAEGKVTVEAIRDALAKVREAGAPRPILVPA